MPLAYRVKVHKCANLIAVLYTFRKCVILQHFVTERDIRLTAIFPLLYIHTRTIITCVSAIFFSRKTHALRFHYKSCLQVRSNLIVAPIRLRLIIISVRSQPREGKEQLLASYSRGGPRNFRWGVRARKIFGHHAHFTCRFRVCEIRLRIFYTRPRDIDARDWTEFMLAVTQQDWHASADCQARK